jgi:hypothetical protein
MMQETKKQQYIRWAISDLLLGKYDNAIRSVRWAKEVSEDEN